MAISSIRNRRAYGLASTLVGLLTMHAKGKGAVHDPRDPPQSKLGPPGKGDLPGDSQIHRRRAGKCRRGPRFA